MVGNVNQTVQSAESRVRIGVHFQIQTGIVDGVRGVVNVLIVLGHIDLHRLDGVLRVKDTTKICIYIFTLSAVIQQKKHIHISSS